MPGTGDAGEPLHVFPAADDVQHCEIAGMRDILDRRTPSLLRRFTGSIRRSGGSTPTRLSIRQLGSDSRYQA
jgi:hypothetical protein